MNREVESYRRLMADVYELAGLSRRLSGRDAAEHRSTSAQWQVLSVIEGEPATVPEIARRLGLTRQGVQRVVNELLGAGHVRRHAADRRSKSPRIEPTRTGRTLLARLWRSNLPRREQALEAAAIDRDELDAAHVTVRRLIEALRAADRG